MSAGTDPSTSTTPRSRRAILAGALGGIGAWAASTVVHRSPARADNGDAMLVGTAHTGTATTSITNSATTNTVFAATAMANGTAIYGYSPDAQGIQGGSENGVGVFGNVGQGIGVYGNSNGQAGVWGQTDGEAAGVVGRSVGSQRTGVLGVSGSTEPDLRIRTGVFGYCDSAPDARGVIGESPAGQGVRGESGTGVGVFALSTSGFALRTDGRLRADKVSGVATIPAGSDRVTVTPGVNVVASTFVLLTPKANLGGRDLWFTTNATADTFTIRLSSPRSSATKVAWLLLG